MPWISQGETITLRFRAVDAAGNCPSPGIGGTYTWTAENADGSGFATVGRWGCGIDTGLNAIESNTGYELPYCTTHTNLKLDNGLNVLQEGVGSHPFSATFDTGSALKGFPIKIKISFAGASADVVDRTISYLVPCVVNTDCGGSADAGATTGARCAPATGLCYYR
jgi:hypothetical protein